MLRGDQFIKMLQGTLEVNKQKEREVIAELTRKYPYAEITIADYNVIVKVKQNTSGAILCMKCGSKLVDRANQVFKSGTWQQMKRKNNMSNWECVKCDPGKGGAPLMEFRNVAKD